MLSEGGLSSRRSWHDSPKGPRPIRRDFAGHDADLPCTVGRVAPRHGKEASSRLVLGELPLASGPLVKDPAAGAYVEDGMPPVPARLAAKIRRWEFVEMGKLLSEFWVGPREVEVELPKERRTRQARKMTDIFTWVQCFGTYVAVLAPCEPRTVPELMAYMGTIVRVSQDYEGLGWVRYDSAFRRQAALSGNRRWSVINGTLFTMNFSGRVAGLKRCELCFATSHNERECAQSGNPDPDLGDRLKSLETAVIAMARSNAARPSPDSYRAVRSSGETCRKWNTSGCTFPHCRHLHVCTRCGGNHPKVRCGGHGPTPRVSPARPPFRPY